MIQFAVPSDEEVSQENKVIFDELRSTLGFVPNIYAVLAYSGNALINFLQFNKGKTILSKREKEVINLVVSQVNGCRYCQSAHTEVARMDGFTDDQIFEIRSGVASFDKSLDALAKFTAEVTLNKGRVDKLILRDFFQAGYTKEALVDIILVIAQISVLNYLYKISDIPIDYPVSPFMLTDNS